MDWFRRANDGDQLRIDAGFNVADSYYFGPDNDFTQDEWEQKRVPLPKVSFPLVKNTWACTEDVARFPHELVANYRRVLELNNEHQKEFSDTYFWLRPVITDGTSLAIGFPWYDTYGRLRSLTDTLLAEQHDGLIYDDLDQCWEIEIHQADDAFYFREHDPDADDTEEAYEAIYRFGRERLREQIRGMLRRLEDLLPTLVNSTGIDFFRLDDYRYCKELRASRHPLPSWK